MEKISAFYGCRNGNNPEIVEYQKADISLEDAQKIIREYPWESEEQWTESEGVGDCIQFIRGDEKRYASYTITPISANQALFDLEVLHKPGIFGTFIGRDHLSHSFDTVDVSKLPEMIRELFSKDIQAIYFTYSS